jgi:hypothetical protein
MKRLTSIQDLQPHQANANRGTKRGVDLLDASLERCGAGRSIVVDKNGIVIAGNHTLERAVEKGFDIQVIKTDGRRLVVVQREDLDLESTDDARARELAIADNRTSQLGLDWDPLTLLEQQPGVELEHYFFPDELHAIQAKGAVEALGETAAQTFGPGGLGAKKTICPNCEFEF